MIATFKEKKVSAILGVLPETISYFDDEVNNYTFPPKQTMRLKRIMGFESHRLAKENSFASDFCLYGLKKLLTEKVIEKEDIGAIIVVTLSPDYFLPQISNIVQGELDLPEDVICIDIAQGCCGYLIGLMEAFLLLDKIVDKKVVLCNVDVLSKKVSSRDRNDFPLIGDGAAITIVENDKTADQIHYLLKMDGKRRRALHIPAGGFKRPNSPETGKLYDVGDGNLRSLDHMHMDGAEVFNFVQKEVPPCIDELLKQARVVKDEIDYYLFHQPNKFMLEKLREKLRVPEEKFFNNLVSKYGNPSGVSIPLVIADNLAKEMTGDKTYTCCLSAFGSGLAWGGMVMSFGKMKYCNLVESNL